MQHYIAINDNLSNSFQCSKKFYTVSVTMKKTKKSRKTKKSVQQSFGRHVFTLKSLLFVGLFATVGSIVIFKGFAATGLVLVSSHLDSEHSVQATVMVDSQSPTKGNTSVVNLTNTSSTPYAKAALVNSEVLMDLGQYKACLMSVSKNVTIVGRLDIVYYDTAPGPSVGTSTFSQPVKEDYQQTTCVHFNNYRVNSLMGAVVYNSTQNGELRVGNIAFTKTGDIPNGLLQPTSRGFSPYAYVPWGDVSMTDVSNRTGVNNYTAAFVQSMGPCVPAWDGNSTLQLGSNRSNIIRTDIGTIRARGGDVTISFGGSGGTELAETCTDITALKNAYKQVVDYYALKSVDFDIEGNAISNSSVNQRRALAIYQLQREKPSLNIYITLSVGTSGLTSNSLNFLTHLRNYQVYLAGINIMTMDYGTNTSNMGSAAIQSATSTIGQLKSIYTNSPDGIVWKALNITAMIGVNDTQPETFTLADAESVRTFANQHKIGGLSFWNINRDKSCAGNAAILSETCSGVVQSPYQFTSIFNMPPN